MIYLITGPSHAGKTLLAQKLLERFKVPYLCIDHLKMGLIRTGKTELTVEDDEKLTGYLWPIVREMIKTAIENKQNLIVEGCYVPFNWQKDFDEDYLKEIKFGCLAMTDEYIQKHFKDIIKHESEIEKRLFDSDLTIKKIQADNHFFINGFTQTGQNVFLISSDYKKEFKNILKTFNYSYFP